MGNLVYAFILFFVNYIGAWMFRVYLMFSCIFICYGCPSSNNQKQANDHRKVNESPKDRLAFSELEDTLKSSRVIMDSGTASSYTRKKNLTIETAEDIIVEDAHGEIDFIIKNGFNIANALPAGYKTDGTVDYTSYVQKALDSHNLIVFPEFPILVNDRGLRIPSNRKIVFLKGSEIVLSPSNKDTYNILLIYDAHDVTLYNPVVIGDRKKHLGNKGEWGMGISVLSSQNVAIFNPTISFCWGDGIYVGKRGKRNSENILVQGAHCLSNRRNGISVTSVRGLKLISPNIQGDLNGTMPMAGICVEPNTLNDNVSNVQITAAVTMNNRIGISIYLNSLFSAGNKQVNVSNIDHRDYSSTIGMSINIRGKAGGGDKYLGGLSGSIVVNNPQWHNNKTTPFRLHTPKLSKLNIELDQPKIQQFNKTLKDAEVREVLMKNINSADAIRISQ